MSEPIDEPQDGTSLEIDTQDSCQVVTLKSNTLRTADEVLEEAKVDKDVWEVERSVVNKWDVAMKKDVEVQGDPKNPSGWKRNIATTELWQVKVWLKRRKPVVRALESIVEEMRKLSLKLPKDKKKGYRTESRRRALEICIMDVHLGLRTSRDGSDVNYDIPTAENLFLWAVDELLELSSSYAPFEQIILPIGNDFIHCDNEHQETTAGTPQPESEDWYLTYARAVKLLVAGIDKILPHAPTVHIYTVPGNHARATEFTLGHYLDAFYHNNPNVVVHTSSDTFKMHEYGCNLIGYEHGHDIKRERLASFMANLNAQAFARTEGGFREIHCGDQHRTGNGRPVVFEEQGVSTEFINSITPGNRWHKKKSYNNQKRGAVAYVWDFRKGQLARIRANINSKTGKPMGTS